jgi:hypothetical protein
VLRKSKTDVIAQAGGFAGGVPDVGNTLARSSGSLCTSLGYHTGRERGWMEMDAGGRRPEEGGRRKGGEEDPRLKEESATLTFSSCHPLPLGRPHAHFLHARTGLSTCEWGGLETTRWPKAARRVKTARRVKNGKAGYSGRVGRNGKAGGNGKAG